MGVVNETSFGVNLKSDQLKGAAASAVDSMRKLFDQVKQDTAAIKALEAAQKNLGRASVVDLVAVKQVTEALAQKNNAVASAQNSILQLAGGTDGAAKAAAAYKRSLSEAAFAAKKTGASSGAAADEASSLRTQLQGLAADGKLIQGPLGGVIGRAESILRLFGSSKLASLALAGAVVGVGVAAVAAAKGLYDVAVGAAEARREEALALQNTASLGKGWADAASQGAAMQAAIDAIAGSSAASRDVVGGLAKELFAAGLRGSALQTALGAAGTVSVVQGAAAASAWIKQAAAVKGVSGAVDKLAAKVDKELGPLEEDVFYSSAVQAAKLHENLQSMFAGVNIEPLNAAKAAIVSLFAESSEAGKAMRAIVGPLSQSLVDLATSWITALRTGIIQALGWFTDLQIGVVDLQIAWLDLRLGLEDAFPKGFWDGLTNSGLGITALGLGMVGTTAKAVKLINGARNTIKAMGGLRTIFQLAKIDVLLWADSVASGAVLAMRQGIISAALWADSMWTVAAAQAAAAALPLAIAAAILGVGAAIYSVIKYWDELKEAFSDFDLLGGAFKLFYDDWVNFGFNLVDGLVSGITGKGFDKAKEAVGKLGKGISHAFKSLLGIESPSKVFTALASQIPAGVVKGISSGQSDVDAAIAGMITPPNLGSLGASGTSGSSNGAAASGGVVVNNVFNFAPGTTDEQAQSWEEAITRVFAGIARQSGAAA